MQDTPTRSYYSISEVSKATKVKAHVLRYWETQFSMLRPRKSRGGIRKYRPKDVSLIEEIKHLLYDRGFTIAGAVRKLREERRAEHRDAAEKPSEARGGRRMVPESPPAAQEQLEDLSVVREVPPDDKVVVPDAQPPQRPSAWPRTRRRAGKPWGLSEIRMELERLQAILQRSPDTLARVARTQAHEMVQGSLGVKSGIVQESPRGTGRTGASRSDAGSRPHRKRAEP